jgi:hypothetical protein
MMRPAPSEHAGQLAVVPLVAFARSRAAFVASCHSFCGSLSSRRWHRDSHLPELTDDGFGGPGNWCETPQDLQKAAASTDPLS